MTPVTVPTVNRKLGTATHDLVQTSVLKLDKPFGTVYSSTESRLVKVAATAPSNNVRADEITIKTTKTDKLTAVVVVMSIVL